VYGDAAGGTKTIRAEEGSPRARPPLLLAHTAARHARRGDREADPEPERHAGRRPVDALTTARRRIPAAVHRTKPPGHVERPTSLRSRVGAPSGAEALRRRPRVAHAAERRRRRAGGARRRLDRPGDRLARFATVSGASGPRKGRHDLRGPPENRLPSSA